MQTLKIEKVVDKWKYKTKDNKKSESEEWV